MYDKTVRRRRVALALLLASSLLLLTAYFGESSGGGLHSVQRGVLQVVSPIQEGASRALKPVRDLVGWFGDTIHAKGQVSDLKQQNADLRRQAIAGSDALRANAELRRLTALVDRAGLASARPVGARVIGQSSTIWYSTIKISAGSSDGVRVGQPVITGDGLIGQVTTAAPGYSIVTLITDTTFAAPARVTSNGAAGDIVTGAGGPRDLQLKYVPSRLDVSAGDDVETRGTVSQVTRFESAFPPGIPIGSVTRVDDAGTDTRQIHVKPFADLQRLEFVQVLTQRVNGNRG